MVSCSEADTKKNCCFRRSSLPYLQVGKRSEKREGARCE